MDHIPHSEKETVKRLIQGDRDAFSKLYIAYKAPVIRFSMRMLKSEQLTEDVFHDVFIAIWQTRKFINPEMPFSAYLFTVVKNRVLNILREEENRNTIKDSMLAKLNEETNATRETILFNDLMLLLEKAKQTLTPKQLEVFELSREKNLSHTEIAGLLHISKNTVREHITAALKQIRQYLHKYGNYPELLMVFIWLNL